MPVPAGPGRAGFPPSPACQRGLVSPASSCQQAGSPRARVRAYAAWHGMAGMPATRARVRPRQAGRQAGRPGQASPYLCPGRGPGPARGWCRPRPCQWPWQACRTSPLAGRAWAGLLCFLSFLSEKPWGRAGAGWGGHAGGYFSAGVTAGKLRGDLFRVAGSYGRYTVRCNGASWGAGGNA